MKTPKTDKKQISYWLHTLDKTIITIKSGLQYTLLVGKWLSKCLFFLLSQLLALDTPLIGVRCDYEFEIIDSVLIESPVGSGQLTLSLSFAVHHGPLLYSRSCVHKTRSRRLSLRSLR